MSGTRFSKAILSYGKQITYWTGRDTLFTLKLESRYKSLIKSININDLEYIRSREDIVHFNLHEDELYTVEAPFNCRIISRNPCIDLYCKDPWIVKIEPVHLVECLNITIDNNQLELNSPL